MERYSVCLAIAEAIWVGVDLHRLRWHVTIRVEDAELFSGSIPGSWESLQVLLEQFPAKRVTVVYEAGYFGFWLYDALIRWGAICTVTPPSLIPQEAGNRVKTDRRDSKKLAFLLMKGLLKSLWIPSEERRIHRDVLRRRQKLVEDRVRVQSRIKAQLQFYGVQAENPPGPWSQRYFRELSSVRWKDRWQEESFRRLLDEYSFLCKQIKEQTTLLFQLATEPGYAENLRLLRTIEGVGVLTGMEVLLELPPMREFSRSEQLAAYVGLTPAQYSSGEHVRMGRITGAGRSHLRGVLIELAWRVVATDHAVASVYERIRRRAGGKRAIVAVARRLLLCMRRMLLDGKPYLVRQAA
jgi:transposase